MAPWDDRRRYFLLAAAVCLADWLTKALVAATLAPGETRHIVPGFFTLTHVRNRGAAFGLFADFTSPLATPLLVAFSVAALGVVLVLLWRHPTERASGYGLALVFGGALGNLVDRLHGGGVVDFLDFHLAGHHWPAFNLADSAIVIGAACVIVHVLRRSRLRHREA